LRQIDGGKLATTINLDIKLHAITFIERVHARAFNRRDVNKCVRLSIIALDEAEALHRVEELDCAGCRFAGQFTLRRAATITTKAATIRAITTIPRGRCTVGYRKRFAFDYKIRCRNLAAAIHQRVLERLTFSQTSQASLFDRRNVNKHVFATAVLNDKAEALLAIEEFNDAAAFANNLGRHRRTACATTPEAAAAASAATETAATAAEAITATAKTVAAAAKAISAAAEPVTAEAATKTAAAAEIIAAKTVALVASAPAAFAAASSVKTHAVSYFPESPPAKNP
jgi:hypothetical protein